MTTWPNWVDLIVITVTLKMCYSGYLRGVVTEVLYLLGAVTVTFLAVNYWGLVAGTLRSWVGFPPHLLAPVVFWVLFLMTWVATRIVLRSLIGLMKWERLHWLVQSIGLVLGGLRGLWWSGFLLLIFTTSGFVYLQQSVEERSIVGPRVLAASRTCLEQLADRIPGGALRGAVLVPPVIPPKK